MSSSTLQEQFGQIDIYLFDQLLKGGISPGMRILDAGCGGGRNILYFLRQGYEVFAVDPDPQAVESVRALAATFAPTLPSSNFRLEAAEQMSFEDACSDVVISNTVSESSILPATTRHFESMLRGSWRVLKPGGLFSLPTGILDRDGEPGEAYPRTPLPISRWFGTIPGGRSSTRLGGRTLGLRTGRSIEDHDRPKSTLDDYMGTAKEYAVRDATLVTTRIRDRWSELCSLQRVLQHAYLKEERGADRRRLLSGALLGRRRSEKSDHAQACQYQAA